MKMMNRSPPDICEAYGGSGGGGFGGCHDATVDAQLSRCHVLPALGGGQRSAGKRTKRHCPVTTTVGVQVGAPGAISEQGLAEERQLYLDWRRRRLQEVVDALQRQVTALRCTMLLEPRRDVRQNLLEEERVISRRLRTRLQQQHELEEAIARESQLQRKHTPPTLLPSLLLLPLSQQQQQPQQWPLEHCKQWAPADPDAADRDHTASRLSKGRRRSDESCKARRSQHSLPRTDDRGAVASPVQEAVGAWVSSLVKDLWKNYATSTVDGVRVTALNSPAPGSAHTTSSGAVHQSRSPPGAYWPTMGSSDRIGGPPMTTSTHVSARQADDDSLHSGRNDRPGAAHACDAAYTASQLLDAGRVPHPSYMPGNDQAAAGVVFTAGAQSPSSPVDHSRQPPLRSSHVVANGGEQPPRPRAAAVTSGSRPSPPSQPPAGQATASGASATGSASVAGSDPRSVVGYPNSARRSPPQHWAGSVASTVARQPASESAPRPQPSAGQSAADGFASSTTRSTLVAATDVTEADINQPAYSGCGRIEIDQRSATQQISLGTTANGQALPNPASRLLATDDRAESGRYGRSSSQYRSTGDLPPPQSALSRNPDATSAAASVDSRPVDALTSAAGLRLADRASSPVSGRGVEADATTSDRRGLPKPQYCSNTNFPPPPQQTLNWNAASGGCQPTFSAASSAGARPVDRASSQASGLGAVADVLISNRRVSPATQYCSTSQLPPQNGATEVVGAESRLTDASRDISRPSRVAAALDMPSSHLDLAAAGLEHNRQSARSSNGGRCGPLQSEREARSEPAPTALHNVAMSSPAAEADRGRQSNVYVDVTTAAAKAAHPASTRSMADSKGDVPRLQTAMPHDGALSGAAVTTTPAGTLAEAAADRSPLPSASRNSQHEATLTATTTAGLVYESPTATASRRDRARVRSRLDQCRQAVDLLASLQQPPSSLRPHETSEHRSMQGRDHGAAASGTPSALRDDESLPADSPHATGGGATSEQTLEMPPGKFAKVKDSVTARPGATKRHRKSRSRTTASGAANTRSASSARSAPSRKSSRAKKGQRTSHRQHQASVAVQKEPPPRGSAVAAGPAPIDGTTAKNSKEAMSEDSGSTSSSSSEDSGSSSSSTNSATLTLSPDNPNSIVLQAFSKMSLSSIPTYAFVNDRAIKR